MLYSIVCSIHRASFNLWALRATKKTWGIIICILLWGKKLVPLFINKEWDDDIILFLIFNFRFFFLDKFFFFSFNQNKYIELKMYFFEILSIGTLHLVDCFTHLYSRYICSIHFFQQTICYYNNKILELKFYLIRIDD